MTNPIIAELCEGQVLQSNPLAIVTRDCIVVRDPEGRSHTIIALARLSRLKRIRTTYPILLVIACGFAVIAAAAFCSKQGSGAGIPASLLGGAFAVGYLLSRRASVAFVVGSEVTETVSGSPSEATALIKAVQAAQDEVRAEAVLVA
jgi:hypothetical protein